MMSKAIVLLSGGIDSATTMAIAKHRGFDVFALTIKYGQRHLIELEAARKVASFLKAIEHKEIGIELRNIGGSALTDDIEVPENSQVLLNQKEIPVTYVPARNTIFLSIALAWAEVIGAFHIFIGANAIDYSGYPDCRPEFIAAFENLANLATKAGVEGDSFKIEAPIIEMSKSEIIRVGTGLGLEYSITHSCYNPNHGGLACGTCDSCIIREKGFSEAGITDPTKYITF
ncbi:7-cyano-7-deazaguanine synthase QueC [bacterium]|nr:7-cyano-7-deazaguanine synthase QueC [bacterium]